jgi:replicative DNA helicase
MFKTKSEQKFSPMSFSPLTLKVRMDAPQSEKRNTKRNRAIAPADVQGRIPPHARELEEAVLGAMMLERDKINSVIDILSEKHFYVPEHQYIFKAIKELLIANSPVDLLTVNNQLRNANELELAGGSYYLAQLTNRVASAANIEFHSRILNQKFVQRELIRVSGEIAVDAYNDSLDSFEMLDDSERKLYDIKNSGLKRSFLDIGALIKRAMEDLEERKGQDNDGITGVATGFSDLDRITSGFQPSDLIIIAARPAMGKTAFALSMARNAAVDFKKSVMIFSLEMADVQLVNRLISGEAEISGDKLRKSDLDESEWLRLHTKTNTLLESKIYIDDTPQLNIFDLNAKCRRVHSQHGLDLVVVDYLQLLRHETKGGQGNREQEIAFISRSLKGLAKELSIPVIALAQLSREVEKRVNKRPQLSDLRESGSIEQDADMVMFLYRDDYYSKMGMLDKNAENFNSGNVEGLTEVIIGKNRHGAVGSAFAKFVHNYSKFRDLEPEERLSLNSEGGGYDNPIIQTTTQTFSSRLNSDANPLMDDDDDGSSWNFNTGSNIFVD